MPKYTKHMKLEAYFEGKLKRTVEETERRACDEIARFLIVLSRAIIKYSPSPEKSRTSTGTYRGNTRMYISGNHIPEPDSQRSSVSNIDGLSDVIGELHKGNLPSGNIMIINDSNKFEAFENDGGTDNYFYWYNVEVSGWGGKNGKTSPYQPFQKALEEATGKFPMFKKLAERFIGTAGDEGWGISGKVKSND